MDPSRYTEPFTVFKENLACFIRLARSKQARPVLITPLERRCFADGRLGAGEHGDYVAAMKQTAAELQVPLVDLYHLSRVELEQAGEQASERWYMNLDAGRYAAYPEGLQDNTHLQYEGAVIYAGCIARGLAGLGGAYRELLINEYMNRGMAEE